MKIVETIKIFIIKKRHERKYFKLINKESNIYDYIVVHRNFIQKICTKFFCENWMKMRRI